ncbi:hypothetical protein MYP_346 [Sporocytophaga myxococcoides]|uniref:Uncharacterized protein n=1 Tax=Sporocytophaga myxococcoides TaxID=153721 RepID=A0A098L8J3_9BACT|nr:hypothetical protein MYP_346 [Sporocytophaga myxococcoides]
MLCGKKIIFLNQYFSTIINIIFHLNLKITIMKISCNFFLGLLVASVFTFLCSKKK